MQKANNLGTRERLLGVAAQLMWERSFHATGVDDLCEKAAAKKGSFYHFFPSKTDLAIAAIEATWAKTRDGFFEPIFSGTGSVGGLGQLKALMESVYEFQLDIATRKGGFLGCPFGNLGQEMARQDERIRTTLQTIFEAHCQYLEGALDAAVAAGEIPPGNNAERAHSIFALLEGSLLMAKVANDPLVFRRAQSGAICLATA